MHNLTKAKPRNSADYQRILGDRIRRLRRERQLTQLDLARQVGVTNGQISTIERGLSAPSIGTLRRISAALEVPLIDFFESTHPREVQIVRHNERRKVTSPVGPEILELLAGTSGLVAVQVLLDPEQTCVRQGDKEATELFMYVLNGQLEVDCQGQSIVIRTGDTIQTDGRYKFVVRNVGELAALLLEVRSQNSR